MGGPLLQRDAKFSLGIATLFTTICWFYFPFWVNIQLVSNGDIESQAPYPLQDEGTSKFDNYNSGPKKLQLQSAVNNVRTINLRQSLSQTENYKSDDKYIDFFQPNSTSSIFQEHNSTLFADLIEAAQKRIQGKETPILLFTMINSAYVKMTESWLCNTKFMSNLHSQTLVFCTEAKECRRVAGEWPEVGFYWWGEGEGVGVTEEGSMRWGLKSYLSFLTLRAQALNALVQANISLVLFETDAIWFENPLRYFEKNLRNSESGLILPLKGYPDHDTTLTFNPMVIRPSGSVKAFFSELASQLLNDRKLYDQDVLESLCRQQYYGVYCETFPWEEIADGKWFKLLDRSSIKPYIVNNNYYIGVSNKISRQALNGLWFLKSYKTPKNTSVCDDKRVRMQTRLRLPPQKKTNYTLFDVK